MFERLAKCLGHYLSQEKYTTVPCKDYGSDDGCRVNYNCRAFEFDGSVVKFKKIPCYK